MIDFTIKTLDAENHHFSVEDETTIQQLKEKVREQLGIEINLQRLIFCGRVLQDEKRLAEYNVHGKVVHLVQRPPPSPEFRNSAHSSSASTNNGDNTNNTTGENTATMQQHIRRLMTLNGPPDFVLEQQQALTLSPTTGRLEFIRRIIAEIKNSLAILRAHIAGEVRENSGAPASRAGPEQMDSESAPTPQEEPDPTIDEREPEELSEAAARAQNIRRRSHRAIRVLRARQSRPRDLGQLIEELEQLQEQFAPHRSHYVRLLRAANNSEPPEYSEEERATVQQTVNMITDIIHSFAHAYHAISDIAFPVGERNPRLSVEPSSPRHPIPLHAHINVIQSNRGQRNAGATATATSGESAGSSASVPATAASNPNQTPTEPRPTPAGRNTTQPTVNINIQPDLTYQVEIETRVPVAIPIDTALLGGLAAATPLVQEQNTASPQGPATQANRRQVLFDLENLIRGLGQAGGLGGVEVVMSMEEIPQAGNGSGAASGNSQSNAGNVTTEAGGNPRPHTGTDIYLAPMAWAGAPSADMLQNIVQSVVRQGLVPGMEVAVHAPIVQSLAQALQGNAGNQGNQGNSQATGQSGAQAQGNQEGGAQPRTPNVNVRRATTTSRSHAVALAGLVYDRYLHCDSSHARRRMARRREQYQQQLIAHERIRNDRIQAQNIEALLDHNIPNLTERHMRLLLELINSHPTREGWMSALVLAIARHIFLSELTQPIPGEPPFVPTEFQAIRLMLRDYIQNLMARARSGDGERSFESMADYITNEYADFINNMDRITSFRPEVDPLRSIRALIRFRLPAAITSVMSESATETFAARFYSIFSRLFTDLCAMLLYFCEEGVEGLRAIYREFMDQALSPLDENVRQTISVLSEGNLNAAINAFGAGLDNVRLFIRRRGSRGPTPPPSDEPEPMEVSPMLPPTRLSDIPLPSDPPPPSSMPFAFREANDSANDQPEPLQPLPPLQPLQPLQPPPPPPPPEPQTESTSRVNLCEICHMPTDEVPEEFEPAITPARATATETQSGSRHAQGTSEASQVTIQEGRPIMDTPPTTEAPRPSTNSGYANNIQFVPPLVIVQHWETEWVPVLMRDQETQYSEPDAEEPYSDAYLSGMPSRKRRCVRQTRPASSLDGFMTETVREAGSERPNPLATSTFRIAFREHMRTLAEQRSVGSQDYDPGRYASAARFLSTRTNKKDSPETERKDKSK